MNVLILGATGTLGSAARQELLNQTEVNLTLFSRSADRLTVDPKREKAVSGDLTNGQELDAVMKGQDVVFAALSGNLKRYAQSIVESMDRNHVQRLIFISSMGFMFSSDIRIDGLESDSKYVFQYVKNVELRNAKITTKDAFWEVENVQTMILNSAANISAGIRTKVLIRGTFLEGLTLAIRN